MNTNLSSSEMNRYSRHFALLHFTVEEQKKLKAARVLVVGAGGLGAPALLYLAAAGIGTLGIVDNDCIEESNLQRQILYSTAVLGASKTSESKKRLQELNPHTAIETFPFKLRAYNAETIIKEFDLVVDASDNFATRYLINDACVVLGKPFIAGAVFRYEGQLSVFNASLPSGRGPTYRCLFPEPPPPEVSPACVDAGVLGALPGMIGSMQALEAIKLITGIGEVLSGRLLQFDALTGVISYINFSRDEKLAQTTRILDDAAYGYVCEVSSMATVKQITVKELHDQLAAKQDIQLIDVRESFEREIASIGGDLIPLGSLQENIERISRDKPVVVYCRSGGRSQRAVQELQDKFGFTNLINLQGGVLAWADQIDTSMKKY